ncbi:MAG: hypothetical protein A3E83_02670 [Gammaproteobacteria bacterium RIFCSPHIGHO2_12_FULL_41_20]|nr:MAG: hypothetical protein A3E83_02670 [Gammaproteobacteria bacterium RIFCSPHIGHO2_12_FULL_41_20]
MTSSLLQDKTALITGASRGLGLYIAKRFWELGSSLILVARNKHKLELCYEELSASTKSQQSIQLISSNLGENHAISQLTQQISHKKIDILVNNAAIQGPIGNSWENNWSEWEQTLQVDLFAPIALCRAVIPGMIQRQYGKIINLSGGGATNARPKFSAYAVSKAGLVRFSETLAEEVNPFNISVNCIAPGAMNTDMLREIVAAGKDKVGEREYTQVTKKIADENSGMQQATELCAFLASPQSDGITGKLIHAVWDPWKNLAEYVEELKASDIYTLRRIVPQDRGKNWDPLL